MDVLYVRRTDWLTDIHAVHLIHELHIQTTLSVSLSHTLTQSLLLTLPLSLNVEQNLPVVAPGILSWTDDDIAELYQSTTRDIASQINAVKGDWRDIIRSAILIQLYVTLPYLD